MDIVVEANSQLEVTDASLETEVHVRRRGSFDFHLPPHLWNSRICSIKCGKIPNPKHLMTNKFKYPNLCPKK